MDYAGLTPSRPGGAEEAARLLDYESLDGGVIAPGFDAGLNVSERLDDLSQYL